MANPFGGSDEALSKNTGHTNQANLIYAVVPRTTSKIHEVITNTDFSGVATGTYDADGYWTPNSTTVGTYSKAISARAINADWTIIVGCKRVPAAGNGSSHSFVGLGQTATSAAAYGGDGIFIARLNSEFEAIQGSQFDGGSAGINQEIYPVSDVDGPYGIALAGRNSTAEQKGWIRTPGGSTLHTFTPATTSLNGSINLNYLLFHTQNRWPLQYLFVYDSYLSDTDINAIIDSPGSVLSAAGGDATDDLGGSAVTTASGTAAPTFSIGL
jgi:hypothetical protein